MVPGTPDYWPALLEDEVIYSPTWGANGNGLALNRATLSGWGDSAASWTAATPSPGEDTTPPTAAITPVTPNPRTSPVSQVVIVFSEPVFGVDLDELSLSLSGGGNLLTAAQNLSSNDNITWTLGNLDGLTDTTGTYSLTVSAAGGDITDAAGNPFSTTTSATWVLAAATTHFLVQASPATVTAGTPLLFSVTALDAGGQTVTGYSGTVTLTTSDSQGGLLPTSSTISGGVGHFIAILKTVGSGTQTITATDSVNNLTGTGTFTVTPAATSQFVVSGRRPAP